MTVSAISAERYPDRMNQSSGLLTGRFTTHPSQEWVDASAIDLRLYSRAERPAEGLGEGIDLCMDGCSDLCQCTEESTANRTDRKKINAAGPELVGMIVTSLESRHHQPR